MSFQLFKVTRHQIPNGFLWLFIISLVCRYSQCMHPCRTQDAEENSTFSIKTLEDILCTVWLKFVCPFCSLLPAENRCNSPQSMPPEHDKIALILRCVDQIRTGNISESVKTFNNITNSSSVIETIIERVQMDENPATLINLIRFSLRLGYCRIPASTRMYINPKTDSLTLSIKKYISGSCVPEIVEYWPDIITEAYGSKSCIVQNILNFVPLCNCSNLKIAILEALTRKMIQQGHIRTKEFVQVDVSIKKRMENAESLVSNADQRTYDISRCRKIRLGRKTLPHNE